MHRLLTAAVLSAALATTGVPARAQSYPIDPGALLAGVITLGLLAAILSDKSKSSAAEPVHQPPVTKHVYQVQPKPKPKPHKHGHQKHHSHKKQPKTQSQALKVTPYTGQATSHSHKPGTKHSHPNGHHAHKHPKAKPGHKSKTHATVLPSHCLRKVQSGGKTQTLYGQYCLSQAGVKSKALPGKCTVKLPSQNGTYIGYDASCLTARGYKVALH